MTIRYRIRKENVDGFQGGEFFSYSDASRWAGQNISGFWWIVPCDIHGEEIPGNQMSKEDRDRWQQDIRDSLIGS